MQKFNWRYLAYIPTIPLMIVMGVTALVAWYLARFFRDLHLWVKGEEESP